eukprot:TRINITY_DN4172_c0_g1_i3.p1 TRINITY_DN4172_c0_g1~~TRINITY_DN4172_c0_g1_i3.p1  ORF type:complete len:447 (-),score=74.18 TRINITY_DN4172_c0_g1_i3:763-2001(-)
MVSTFNNLCHGSRPVGHHSTMRSQVSCPSSQRLVIKKLDSCPKISTISPTRNSCIHDQKLGRGQNLIVRAQLSEQKQPQVVSIGEGLFDLIADQKGLSREEVKSWTGYPGGAPANVASALSKLGVPVMLYSALGKDERGDELFSLLTGNGVNMSAVLRCEQPTRDVYVVRDNDGDREFAGFGLPTTDYSDCFITEESLPVEAIQNAQILVTGSLSLAYPTTGNTLAKAVQIAKKSGTKVLIDVNWRPVFFLEDQKPKEMIYEYVQQADLVKITDDEAEWLFGIEAATALANPNLVLDRLPNAMGALVTGGEKGAAFCFKSQGSLLTGFVPVFKASVVDTTGAGDAFTGGFLSYVLLAGGLDAVVSEGQEKLLTAVRFGAACGALTTQGPGAIAPQPSFEMVEKLAQEGALVS